MGKKYEGRLTPDFTTYPYSDRLVGKDEQKNREQAYKKGRVMGRKLNDKFKPGSRDIAERRYIGGVKFKGNVWTVFDENDVDMDEINQEVEYGTIEIKAIKSKAGRPPKKPVEPTEEE